ncbi:peptidoglycan-binding protein LysM [Xylophilus ampelinus]|uniref:Potassium binding protein Kbp n=1 Tax=Xylophilus ampelinus TaxID=54067 RepID=A0A318SLT1_9BURK|nr:peptidoglycan-binding protein LysM [Xylophilus ampelinus]MCS4510270.1 peptidoglycan-binding protein LysM [Xylophilus ampelinus]PYE78109.1 BON domain-containing protein [Xylophilus ampelinus]
MGLISFIKDAGEKLFGHANAATPAATAAAAPSTDDLNAKAGAAIKTYIETQKLGITGLTVTYDGAATKVSLAGQAPTQEASEKAALAAGNVSSVTQVDNQLTVAAAAAAADSQYHDVAKGDTLSAIAKKYYGDANKYPKIFEANKPMLSDPDKIYPGQKLRIPAL